MKRLKKEEQLCRPKLIKKTGYRKEEWEFNECFCNPETGKIKPVVITKEASYSQCQKRKIEKIHQQQHSNYSFIVIFFCLTCPADSLIEKSFPCFHWLGSNDNIFRFQVMNPIRYCFLFYASITYCYRKRYGHTGKTIYFMNTFRS